ncbi:MAG: GNAT family N-acetyltransferase [Betaproteobacteria bacterium]
MLGKDYVTRVLQAWSDMPAAPWNALLGAQGPESVGPFMRQEYLAAMQSSGSATEQTGWGLRIVTVWQGDELLAACPLYLKDHSYGEYVFDWAWANAYQQHGLSYYPKALVASPFTPVPGPRLLAKNEVARLALVQALLDWCREEQLSSLHLLFLSEPDLAACTHAGLMLRQTVQFHWQNQRPSDATRFADFDDFLASLSQDKRKKIRQERRKVAEAGVVFRWSRGKDIAQADWDFFYRCYERTYLEHGNRPYLSRDFFAQIADQIPEHWLLFMAEREGRAIGSSLIGLSQDQSGSAAVAYGRYWGALERVDCLHFEACYYQPLAWCIEQGVGRFEGGAQGEHKMARALMPTPTHSAHWLAHPAFANAVERFLEREGEGVQSYLEQLQNRTPFRQP